MRQSGYTLRGNNSDMKKGNYSETETFASIHLWELQSNLSNSDGLFTRANSNSFLSPYKILLIAQNKY